MTPEQIDLVQGSWAKVVPISDTVATLFLWTLEKGLGDAFTPPVKDAWIAAYTVLSTTMKEAAQA